MKNDPYIFAETYLNAAFTHTRHSVFDKVRKHVIEQEERMCRQVFETYLQRPLLPEDKEHCIRICPQQQEYNETVYYLYHDKVELGKVTHTFKWGPDPIFNIEFTPKDGIVQIQ